MRSSSRKKMVVSSSKPCGPLGISHALFRLTSFPSPQAFHNQHISVNTTKAEPSITLATPPPFVHTADNMSMEAIRPPSQFMGRLKVSRSQERGKPRKTRSFNPYVIENIRFAILSAPLKAPRCRPEIPWTVPYFSLCAIHLCLTTWQRYKVRRQ